MRATPAPGRPRGYVLIVDDDPDVLEAFEQILILHSYQVYTAETIQEAKQILLSHPCQVLLTDLSMPGGSGLDLLKHVQQEYPKISSVMITGYASIESAVEAISLGASAYLQKPVIGEKLVEAVEKAFTDQSEKKENPLLAGSLPAALHGLVGESEALRQVVQAIEKAARADATVLITGESGTGKELVARAIHYASSRAAGPFVPVNCGGIPESLLESELFGHMKGAFTGANVTRPGFFQAADSGTLFLDEVGEISESMQVKLLRVLEDQKVYLVGSRRAKTVNVRLLAASNKNLQKLLEDGRMRDDFYYRLNVINIHLPPLRERLDDIPLLVNHFSTKYARQVGQNAPSFSGDAMDALRSYSWPGNIRELENFVHSQLIMHTKDHFTADDIPFHMTSTSISVSGGWKSLEEMGHEYIYRVYLHHGKNKKKAAEILQIDRKTLDRKLKKIENGK